MVLRLVSAAAAAAAIILSAPFAQELFSVLSTTWPQQFRNIAIGATALPACIALLAAVARIHNRHLLRYGLLAFAAIVGAVYISIDALSVTESFHFVEYGALGFLFYRVWRSVSDVSLFVVPILATTIAGTFDEWFQWFIPIRAGEARDIVLNGVAGACGVLIALAVDPPDRLGLRLQRGSARRVMWCSVGAGVVFAAFFWTVHVGYDVSDPEVGSFPSRFSADALVRASQDRTERWRNSPPVVQRRLSREDQYLTEGLWHVARRNGAWAAGDVVTAWRENRILEKFYVPVLDTPSYAGRGQRWPSEQRADAGERVGSKAIPYASHDYAYPLYVWTGKCCSF